MPKNDPEALEASFSSRQFVAALQQNLFHLFAESISGEGLDDVAIAAGKPGVIFVVLSRDQDNRNIRKRRDTSHLFDQLWTIHGLHLPIREDEPVTFAAKPLQC